MESSSIVPCVIFAFNRPHNLKNILDALKPQGLDRLIIFIDGPRTESDVEAVTKCKHLAQNIHWVGKELYQSAKNHGLTALPENIDTVLNKYSAAVFIEDDCLPMPGFYDFMKRSLQHYENKKRVFSIAGYQAFSQKYLNGYEISLVSLWRFNCWGWGTWQDRWSAIKPLLSCAFELFNGLTSVPDIAGKDLARMARKVKDGRTQSWAIRVALATLHLEMFHLTPVMGLIKNIGITDGGVHSSHRLEHSGKLHNVNLYKRANIKPIRWLERLEPTKQFTIKLQNFINNLSEKRNVNGCLNRLRTTFHDMIKRFLGSLMRDQHQV